MSDQGFERVATVSALDDGMPASVRLENGDAVCLVRVNDEVYALADACSHADFPMSDGDMVDDYVIECSLHGAQFDVRTGAVLELPADEPLTTYEVRIDDDAVLVRPRSQPASE
ncbi:MAG: non-heme iron oxygenase ferredoxin subunit [Gemmatimonadota bacterium]|nr:non-heme iron oxygenase ferredoxin subunit [Gemmatimonadota bacterium]